MTVDEQVDKLWHQTITKYHSPGVYDKLYAAGWTHSPHYHFVKGAVAQKAFIKNLLETGHRVRAGYSATSVRGYHNRDIYYKRYDRVHKTD